MPITAFNSFTDGLDPNRTPLPTPTWKMTASVPYADGVWFQPCCFNVTSGGFSVVLKGLPGAMLGTHTTWALFMAIRCVVIGDT